MRLSLHPLVLAMACIPLSAFADCTTTGLTTTCDTDAPNPWTSTVGVGAASPSGRIVNLTADAQVVVGDANAISVGTDANITIGANALVQNNAVTTGGQSGAFGNTIEFGSNSLLTIEAGARVLANGPQVAGEAIGVVGVGTTIVNRGLLAATSGAAIWFEGGLSGTNTIDNYGTIRTALGANANVIGANGTKTVIFTNRNGARVEGSLFFGGGNDVLTLEAGSVITGNFNGGGGTNVLNLLGDTGTSDSLAGNIANFSTLNKQGLGTWAIDGALSGNLTVNVDAGTLALTGNNTAFTGSIVVDAAATLQGDADALPPTVTDNGTVLFNQATTGTYGGAISGAGTVIKQDAGDVILSGASTYTGGTRLNAGFVQANANAALGAATGALTFNGGGLRLGGSFNLSPERAIDITFGSSGTIDTQAFNTTISQDINGGGALTKTGTGTLTLTGSTYVSRTTISAGTVQLGNGGTTGDLVGRSPITNNGTLAINRSDDAFIGSLISGTGGVNQIGSGAITLFANNTYTGATNVNAGALYVDGNQTTSTGATTVASGAALGGSGIIGGAVTMVGSATLNPGDAGGAPGTLTINGALALSGGNTLNYSFGEAGVAGGTLNDLITVGGDLTLDGTLNVDVPLGGSFGPGIYRVFNYAGALTNNGLALGAVPSTDVFVQTAVANQVNLVNAEGLLLNYWDGDAGPKNDGNVNGGNGTWQASGGNDNWTDVSGSINAPFSDAAFAIFQGAAGTVSVDNSQGAVTVAGMQFAGNGYTVQGDAIVLAGSTDDPTQSIIRVGDGTAAGAGYTATINSALSGASGLIKTDAGTLVLGGTNTYAGGTAINGGTLRIASDSNLGAAPGAVSIDTGTLETTADIVSGRAVTLAAGGGTLTQGDGTTLTLDGVMAGAGALTKQGLGSLELTADNTYAGGTTIGAGRLQLGNGGTTGSLLGNIANNGTLAFNRSDIASFSGVISGTGALEQVGTGTTVLTAENTYTGGTTISAGTLQLGDGGTTGSLVGNVVNNGVLAVNRSNELTFGNLVTGTGALQQNGTGTTVLTGNNTYTGATDVTAGALYVDGDQSAATGATTVDNGATLGGAGTIGGSVTVADGATLAPGGNGAVPGTLTINGALALGGGSFLNYSFGEANVPGGALNDLTNVNGDLTLDGTLNVSAGSGGSFGPGVYRVINYSGALIDNGLAIGTIPSPSFLVQTGVASQVNLINTAGLQFNVWDGDAGPKNDGTINGGNGTWQNVSGNDNWTDATGLANASFADAAFALFQAAPGTVTVDGSLGGINVAGMQFASDGYIVQGDAIALVGSATEPARSIVRVGDGTTLGAGYTATVNSALTGTSGLVKSDLGTLVLGGTNSYSGGTSIEGGVLQVSSDANLGAAAGALAFDGGTLRTTADIATSRATTLNAGGGTVESAEGTRFVLGGAIGGTGALTKTGAGTAILTAANTYAGGTTIAAGTLQLGDGGTAGGIVGDIVDNGVLAVNRSNEAALNGAISGTGALQQNGGGTTILAGDNTFTGGTTIAAGTLQLGAGGASGSVVGGIIDNGTLAFNRSDVFVMDNTISGSGGLAQLGSGTTVLTGQNTLAGAHNVSAGTLAVGDAAHAGVVLSGGPTTVRSGGTLGGYGTVAGSVSNAGTVAVADAVGAFAGAKLAGSGTFAIRGTLNNSGVVQIGGVGVGNRLVVGGYVGQGGQIVINTQLESDNSLSDRLVIDGGTATGTSTLRVNNVGGAGALTPGNGILVVEPINGATTSAGAFTLGQRVIAGPYEYSLFRGARDGSLADAWFLRTEIDDHQTPEFRPEVSAYAALPSMAIGFGRATIGTLHERVGEASAQQSEDGRTAWTRVLGEGGDWNAKAGGIYADGPSFEQNFSGLQIGTDVFAQDRADGGRTQIGLYGIAGQGDGKVDHFDGSRAGSNKFDAYALGAYGTWYGANETYLDAVLQGTWYDAHAGSDEIGRLKTDGTGYSASLEAGRAFELAKGWRIEPQAQVVYQRVRLDASSDRVAAVRFGDVESLAGRLGARFVRSWETSQGRAISTWFRGNVWHETNGDSKVRVSSDNGFMPFRSSLKGTWYDVSAGISAKVAGRVSLYANVGYQKAFDEGIQAFNGSLGLRLAW